MRTSEHWHTATDRKRLFYRRFLPEREAKAIVFVAHGLAEHSARYAPTAEELTHAGYAVYANDHRGHGQTGTAGGDLGWFEGGAERVLEDLRELFALARAEHSARPLYLLGHSMGSFFAQALMITDGAGFQGVVLSGTTGNPPPVLATVGWLIGHAERLRLGPRGQSALLRQLTFGAFNKPFEPGPTKFEWLSRNREAVELYVGDPLCGFDASVQLSLETLDLIQRNARPERRALIPKDLPVYVLTGGDDPVSERGKGVKQLLAAYQAAGLSRVAHKFYEGARHEILNEVNRDEVRRDLVAWLDAQLA